MGELPNLIAEIEVHRRTYGELSDELLSERLEHFNDLLVHGDSNGELLPHHQLVVDNIVNHLAFELAYRKGYFDKEEAA